jgi:hypothetical protein
MSEPVQFLIPTDINSSRAASSPWPQGLEQLSNCVGGTAHMANERRSNAGGADYRSFED